MRWVFLKGDVEREALRLTSARKKMMFSRTSAAPDMVSMWTGTETVIPGSSPDHDVPGHNDWPNATELDEAAVGLRAVKRACGRSLVLSGVILLTGCGGAKPTAMPSAPAAGAKSGVEHFFPLEQGKIDHYVTREGTDTGMLVAKVHRTDATHGELRLSNATKRFVIAPDVIGYDGGAVLLKAPLEVGTSWPGEHGGTTSIVATDVMTDVPAGHYAGCLTTVEEAGRPPGSRYESTYCPGVGMVLLVVRAGGSEARAELKSYGLPVKLE